MGLLDSLRRLLGGGQASGEDANITAIYVRCRRCGEPLKGRVDMRNEPSLAEDSDNWVVRKGLMGSGENLCFQTVEVILTFDPQKRHIVDSEVIGGTLITAEEYAELIEQREETKHA
jgi:hypothetical protein